jgi:hypothetical protein
MLGLAAVTISYSVVWTVATRNVRRSFRRSPAEEAAA